MVSKDCETWSLNITVGCEPVGAGERLGGGGRKKWTVPGSMMEAGAESREFATHSFFLFSFFVVNCC